MGKRRLLAIYIAATNDVNGNPRRGWIVTEASSGDMVDFVDEGHGGIGYGSELAAAYPGVASSHTIAVTPGAYLKFKALGAIRRAQKGKVQS